MFTDMLRPEIMGSMLPEGFPADKLSQPQYKMTVERDVMVEVRDGVHIAVDVFRPDAPGKFPALLCTSPYQKDLVYLPAVPVFHMRETNDIEWFVSRGYVYVHMDVRGSGKSVEGQWQYFSREEQNDSHDVIEWTSGQPWCTGKVGLIGESYPGEGQWFAAATQPPHLACILPWDAMADIYRDKVYQGGILAAGFLGGWHTTEIRAHYRLGSNGPDPNVGKWDLPWEVLQHPTFDEFWEVRSADFSKIKCPVFTVGALHKVGLHLRGVVRGYEELKTPKKMMLVHGEVDGDEMAIFNSQEMRLLMLRWYDHWLKGNDTGFMEEPPVTIFVRGADRYRAENEWPLVRTDYKKMYLHPGQSGAVESLNDGRLLGKPPSEATSSFTYSYPNPDWTGYSGAGSAVIERGILHPTKRILTFTSDPLDEDLEIAGSIVLHLYASSDQEDTDFMVRVVDQEPDNMQLPGMPPRGIILTRGWLKASHACTKDESRSKPYRPYYRHDNPQPIEPGRIYRYDIEVWPTCNLFKAGHRIRLDVSCHDSGALDFGGHYYGLKVGQDTYFHDREHPSHIVLPVISS